MTKKHEKERKKLKKNENKQSGQYLYKQLYLQSKKIVNKFNNRLNKIKLYAFS